MKKEPTSRGREDFFRVRSGVASPSEMERDRGSVGKKGSREIPARAGVPRRHRPARGLLRAPITGTTSVSSAIFRAIDDLPKAD